MGWHFTIRPRFLHLTHRGDGNWRGWDFSGTGTGMFYPGPHLGAFAERRYPQDRLLCGHFDGFHRIQKRGNHGVRSEEISPV